MTAELIDSTRAVIVYAPPDACRSRSKRQIDGVEFGNPLIMQRQQWAMDMAMDESRLPPGAHGAGSYSSHPNDSTGTWAGDAAVISQIDAFRAFRSQ